MFATSQGCHVYPEQHDASRAAGQSFCSAVQGISGTRFFELWPARKKKAFFLYLLDFFRLDEESCIKSKSKDFSICLSSWYVAVRSNLPQKASEWGTECLWYLIKLGHSNRKHNLLSVFESASPIRYPEAQTPEQVFGFVSAKTVCYCCIHSIWYREYNSFYLHLQSSL